MADFTPPPGESLTSLQRLLHLGSGEFTLAFVYYDRASQRSALLSRLERSVADLTLSRVSLQDTALDLDQLSDVFFEQLWELARKNAGGHDPSAVLLLDWEHRLALDQPPDRQPSTSLVGVFNLGRHLLKKKFACPVVIFLPQAAMTILMRLAPDFVSWKSGSFYFPDDPRQLEADLRAAVSRAETPAQSREAAVQLREVLDDVLGEGAPPMPAELVAQALERLGYLHLGLKEGPQAIWAFDRLAAWVTGHSSQAWSEKAAREAEEGGRHAGTLLPRVWATADLLGKVFRGAAALEKEDGISGREEDLALIQKMLFGETFRCGVIWGETGSGKTSLLRAGLIPALTRQGNLPVYIVRYGDDPERALCQAVAAAAHLEQPPATLAETLAAAAPAQGDLLILLCDQFEQVFGGPTLRHRANRTPFLKTLAACINNLRLPVRVLLLMSSDRLFHLTELDAMVPFHRPLDPENRYELRWMQAADAARVLASLGERALVPWPKELIAAIVDDLASGGERVRPVEVQLVAAGLYLRQVHTMAGYEKAGRRGGLLRDYLNAIFETLPNPELAPWVVRALVAEEPPAPPRRASFTVKALAQKVRATEGQVQAVLDGLAAPHVVQTREDTSPRLYELVHDVLIEPALRATAPHEIGLNVLRSALAKGRWRLRRREYLAARRSDLTELPEPQKAAARALLRRTTLLFVGSTVLAVLLLTLALLTAIQLTRVRPQLNAEPPEYLAFHRGARSLRGLPWFLSSEKQFELSISVEDVPSYNRGVLDDIRLSPGDDGRSADARRLFGLLAPSARARWLCYAGDWKDGVEAFCTDPDAWISTSRIHATPVGPPGALAAPVVSSGATPQASFIPASLLPLLATLHDQAPHQMRTFGIESINRRVSDPTTLFEDQLHWPLAQEDSPPRWPIELGPAPAALLGPGLFRPPWSLPLQQANLSTQTFQVASALVQPGSEDPPEDVYPLSLPILPPIPSVPLTEIARANPEKAVAVLVPLLLHADRLVREKAFFALALAGGSRESEVVPELLRLCDDRDARTRVMAVWTLGYTAFESADAVAVKLLALLAGQNDPDNAVRRAAAGALVQLGLSRPEIVVPKLVPLLAAAELDVRGKVRQPIEPKKEAPDSPRFFLKPAVEAQVAAWVLDSIESVRQPLGLAPGRKDASLMPAWLGRLEDESAGQLLDQLVRLVTQGKLRVVWRRVLENQFEDETTDEIGTPVLRALLQLADKLPAAIEDKIVKPLSAADGFSKGGSLVLRGLARKYPDKVLSHLLGLLKHSDKTVRLKAALAIGSVGREQAAATVAGLLPLLNDEDEAIRVAAVRGLGRLGAGRKDEIVRLLVSMLKPNKPDQLTRWNQPLLLAATTALEMLGADASPEAADALLKLIEDKANKDVQIAAAWALGRAGRKQAEQVIPPLRKLLKDRANDSLLGEAAAVALGRLGATDAVDDILNRFSFPDRVYADAAVWALGKLNEQDRKVAQKLRTALSTVPLNAREPIARSLSGMSETLAEEAVKELVMQVLSDRIPPESNQILKETGLKQPRVVLPALFAALVEPKNVARYAASMALFDIGREKPEEVARAALPLLNQADGRRERQLIAWTLDRILSQPEGVRLNAENGRLEPGGNPLPLDLIDAYLDLATADAPFVRGAAVQVLGRIPADKSDFVTSTVTKKLLKVILDDKNPAIRVKAAQALNRIGLARPEALPSEFLALMSDEQTNAVIRFEAAQALLSIARSRLLSDDEVRWVRKGMGDREALIRNTAQTTLSGYLLSKAFGAGSRQSVCDILLRELQSNTARLDARYRQAVVGAMFSWSALGEAQLPGAVIFVSPAVLFDRPLKKAAGQAAKEYGTLRKELEKLRDGDSKLWLRAAACEALATPGALSSFLFLTAPTGFAPATFVVSAVRPLEAQARNTRPLLAPALRNHFFLMVTVTLRTFTSLSHFTATDEPSLPSSRARPSRPVISFLPASLMMTNSVASEMSSSRSTTSFFTF